MPSYQTQAPQKLNELEQLTCALLKLRDVKPMKVKIDFSPLLYRKANDTFLVFYTILC